MKKGFTLIELLAVTVLISIISVIAVPIVLNLLETSKRGAAKNSCYAYIEASLNYVTSSEMKGNFDFLYDEKYYLTKDTLKEAKVYPMMNDKVNFKGNLPYGENDYIIINHDGVMVEAEITISGYLFVFKKGKLDHIEKQPKVPVRKLALNSSKEIMEKGSTFEIKPIFTPSNVTNQKVTYKSNDNEIASVDEKGLVKALKVGKTEIIVTSEDNKKISAVLEIEVIISATGLVVEPKEKTIKINSSLELKGILTPDDTSTKALSWSSSDDNIVEVSSTGLLKARKAGTVIITAETVNGIKATSKITVENYRCSAGSLTVSGNQYICTISASNRGWYSSYCGSYSCGSCSYSITVYGPDCNACGKEITTAYGANCSKCGSGTKTDSSCVSSCKASCKSCTKPDKNGVQHCIVNDGCASRCSSSCKRTYCKSCTYETGFFCNSCNYSITKSGTSCEKCGSICDYHTYSYYCGSGWSTYSGSGSNLICYQKAQ